MPRTFGKAIIAVVILNELRGLAVAGIVIASWLHGGALLTPDLP